MLACLNETQKERIIGEKGFYISIPAKITRKNKWHIYTRFSHSVDPENHILTLEKSGENGDNQVVLRGSHTVRINCNMCTDAGWQAGDTVSIKFDDTKIIMRRIKKGIQESHKPVVKRPQNQEILRRVHMSGHFPLIPDRKICTNNRWRAGTLFSCVVREKKIILEESAAGTRKISEYTGIISITGSMCRAAKLKKGDPLKIDYEGKKIIIRGV